MPGCPCQERHLRRRIALTGGPGAGKTAVLELLKRSVCEHVALLPEAAGIVFGGGFPRRTESVALAAAQRAIYHIQCELEAVGYRQLSFKQLEGGVGYLAVFEPPAAEKLPQPGRIMPCKG